jgi:hypothetical protein
MSRCLLLMRYACRQLLTMSILAKCTSHNIIVVVAM